MIPQVLKPQNKTRQTQGECIARCQCTISSKPKASYHTWQYLTAGDLKTLNVQYASIDVPFESDITAGTLFVKCKFINEKRRDTACMLPDLFWIDSICICQDSREEKQQQIRLMETIFSRAALVAACIDGDGVDEPLYSSTIQSSSLHEHEWPRITASLAERPYFSRLWTVQETLLPKRVDMFCGRLRREWTLAGSAFVGCGSYADHIPQEANEGLAARFHDTQVWGSRDANGDANNDLASVIHQYGSMACKEPRDKIYAVLALTPKVVQRRMKIDYQLSLADVILSYAALYDRISQGAYAIPFPVRQLLVQKMNGDEIVGEAVEVLPSIRLLASEFVKASSTFRKELLSFCKNDLREGDTRTVRIDMHCSLISRVPSTGCLRSMHEETTDKPPLAGNVADDATTEVPYQVCVWCDTISESDFVDDSRQIPTIFTEEEAGDLSSRSIDRVIWIFNNIENKAEVAFEVPFGTCEGDLLVRCAYISFKKSREDIPRCCSYWICRKSKKGRPGLDIIGEARHVLLDATLKKTEELSECSISSIRLEGLSGWVEVTSSDVLMLAVFASDTYDLVKLIPRLPKVLRLVYDINSVEDVGMQGWKIIFPPDPGI